MMMCFPNMLSMYKAIIMLILGLMTLSLRRVRVYKIIQYLYISYVFFGLYQIFTGLIFDNKKPFDWLTVTILWPIFFFICLPNYNNDRSWLLINRTIFFSHIFIVTYDLIFCFGVIFGFDVPNIYASVMDGQIPFTFYEGFSSRLNFVNLNTITFTTPFLFVLWLSNKDYGIKRFPLMIVLIMTFVLFIISGRRSVMLIFALCPILIILFKDLFPKQTIITIKKSLLFFSIMVFVGLFIFYSINPDLFLGYFDTFIRAFDSEREPIKFAQNKMFIKYISENPFFGVGGGAEFYEPYPGRGTYGTDFELTYHLALARSGIFGIAFWIFSLFGVIFIAYQSIKKYKDLVLLGIVYGYLFMLVANATNPVFCCFDFMLSYLLCTARINFLNTRS